MAFKMDAGRGNYAKTGKGIPMVLRQDPPVDPKKGKPNAVRAVQETVSSPMGGRPRPAAPIGTFGSSGRNSGAMVSDLKRMARQVYSGITGKDGADAPSWMQQR